MNQPHKAEADIAMLRSALAGLVGADTEDELRQMEAAMRLLPAPEEVKAVSINAIHALLSVGRKSEAPSAAMPAHEDARRLQHCAIAVLDWLKGGCEIHDIPRTEISALAQFVEVAVGELAGPHSATGTIKTTDLVAKYRDDEAAKQAVFDRVITYFREHECFHGESIHQSDNPIIDAPNVMSDIADNILKFDVASLE